MSVEQPAISVVIPTVDRVALLDRCLRGIAAQVGAPAYEVLVVHDGDPGVMRLLARWSELIELRPLQIGERGVSAKRNAGIAAAMAPVLALTDDDCEPDPGWLRAGAAAFSDDPGVDLVIGPIRPHPGDDARGPWARTITATSDDGIYVGANMFVRQGAARRIHGFDLLLRAGEDTDFGWRVRESGGTVAWCADASVRHAVRVVGFRDHLRSLPRWADLAEVVRRHPELRERAYHRYVWKRSHASALPALAGIILAVRWPPFALLAVPHLAWRAKTSGVRAAPAMAVTDLVEVGVMVTGSVRHRCILI